MQIAHGTVDTLSATAFRKLAQYRYRVFVEQLGWPMGRADGLELDQFDQDHTEYVFGVSDEGNVCGCGRLLPTTRAYLLDEVFPYLLDGLPRPRSDEVWELSRFSAVDPAVDPALDLRQRTRRSEQLLLACLLHAAARGARRLITVSPLGIERLLKRMGAHAHRAGPPCRIGDELVFACWIEIDEPTLTALSRPAAPTPRPMPRPSPVPFAVPAQLPWIAG